MRLESDADYISLGWLICKGRQEAGLVGVRSLRGGCAQSWGLIVLAVNCR